MNKVFISTSSFAGFDGMPMRTLEEKGIKAALNPHGRALTKEEIINFLSGVTGLIAGTETLDRDVLISSGSLKVISRCGAGIDNIDLKAAKELGIKVFSTPQAPCLAVAELTIGLIFSLLRRIPEADSSIKSAKWNKIMGNLLYSKKAGIIGLGSIGKKVAQLLMPFGVKIMCSEPNPDENFIRSYNIVNTALEKILSDSDIVTLHCTAKPNGSYLIGAKELNLMKKSAILINTARGSLIDEQALFEALKNNRISGAGIDVFAKEPYAGPLRDLKNAVLTPHIGSYAKEARINMEQEAAVNLIKGLGL